MCTVCQSLSALISKHGSNKLFYSVLLTKRGDIFKSLSTTFEVNVVYEAAGAVSKIGSSLKRSHHKTI